MIVWNQIHFVNVIQKKKNQTNKCYSLLARFSASIRLWLKMFVVNVKMLR